MGILSWIVFGLIAGALAKWIMPGNDPGGIIVTIIIGVIGAFVGGYVGTLLGLGTVDGFDIRSFFIAILGAILLLAGYRFAMGKK
ncbi:MAG: GlsB/YeaQ/YmgE family stress response membrane protein [Planctomycetaceae bacterium]|nr:GlsB/YeaQ/YmgE family stress response membrane protein [Planctomycetaceae bacterium]